MTQRPTLRFVTRQRCELCDEALAVLAPIAARRGVVIDEVDVASDDALLAAYGLRIPVVLDASGRVVAEGRLSRRAARRAVRAATGFGG